MRRYTVVSQGRIKDALFVLDHLSDKEPGNCVAFSIGVFERLFKFSKVPRERVVEVKISFQMVDAQVVADSLLYMYMRG